MDMQARHGEQAFLVCAITTCNMAYEQTSNDCWKAPITSSVAAYDYAPCGDLILAIINTVSSILHSPFSLLHSYAYDALGRPVSRNADTFGYNARGEVVSATVAGGSPSPATATYAYDSIGNLLSHSSNAATNTCTANSLNQYTSILCASVPPCETTNPDNPVNPVQENLSSLREFSYDADGNLLSDGEFTYAYDAEDRLLSVTSATLTNGALRVVNSYDYRNRRIGKTTERYGNGSWLAEERRTFVYDGWNLIHETNEAFGGGATNITEKQYFWGLDLSNALQGAGGVGGLLAVSIGGQFYFPAYDANGNITKYLDESGNIVASYTYDAFGNTIAQSGAMADAFVFRFSTKYLDDETGLYYYGYRFYSPLLMRWLNRDPIEEQSGVNLYAMCENNCVIHIDSLGKTSVNLNTRFEFDSQEGSVQPTFQTIVIDATVLGEPDNKNFLNFIQIKRVANAGVWELDKKGNWPYYYQNSELTAYTSKDENGHRILTLKDSPRGAYSDSWEFVTSIVEVSRKCKTVYPSGLGHLCIDSVTVLDSVQWVFDNEAPLLDSLHVSQQANGNAIMRQILPKLVKDKLWQIEWLCPTKLEIR